MRKWALNLMKFRREDGEFDVEAFQHAVDTVFLAQEIIVGYSSYPTPQIERNAKAYRELGLGYADWPWWREPRVTGSEPSPACARRC